MTPPPPTPHPSIADKTVFAQAGQILGKRSRRRATRAANGSDYLLAGLVTCTHCTTKFIGNAADGRTRRYRYYTCHTCHRYGPDSCAADRLPADALDHAIIGALVATYADADLVAAAITRSRDRNHGLHAQHKQEHRAVTADIAVVEQAIDRLLVAYETGAIPAAICGDRIRTQNDRLHDLQTRRDELAELLDTATTPAPSPDQIADTSAALQRAHTDGSDQQRKALLQTLVHDIKVVGRDHIQPVFRLPTDIEDAVRIVEQKVGMALHNANRPHTIDGPSITVSRLRATLADSRPSCRQAVLDAIDRLQL